MLQCRLSKKEFVRPLSLIQGVVDKKTVMSLLKNVHLYTNDGALVMEGTDLERSLRYRLPCEIHEDGAVLVDAKQLYEIVKEFPSDSVELWVDDSNWLHIEGAKRASYKLGASSPEDFPRFLELQGDSTMTLAASMVEKMVEKTIYAAATSDGGDRYGFGSMLVEIITAEDGDYPPLLRSVCTNGHRLALFDQELTHAADRELSILIPRKCALEMRRIAEVVEGEIGFGIEDKYCYLANDDITLILRLSSDSTFPQYKLILPEEKRAQVVIDREGFYNALKRVTIVTADGIDTRGVIATISSDEGLVIEPLQKERGDARERLEIEFLAEDEERIELAFNARYMMEAIGVMDSDRINFSYPSQASPCFIWGDDDPGYLAFIMPLKLDRE